MSNSDMRPHYEKSHALVIGINDYKTAPPLIYAVSDAQAVSDILQKEFDFPKKNIRLLIDNEATRSSILETFLSFASDGTDTNDRLLVFFAGHGYTIPARKGEVGFLVPHDGDENNLATLIRWDELTRNADLINAKHILFLMDACYGGLAITRALKPGASRFLKSMLLRPARQVLTAGKADEVVADSGGPLPHHSVFTGHLLEGLEGNASNSDGLITANGVIAYVYQKVGHDQNSKQTPHFGYLDGDGDFIFAAPQLSEMQDEEKKSEDILVSVPAVFTNQENGAAMTFLDQAKEFLSEDRHKIKLHELVVKKTRETLSLTAKDHFPSQARWNKDDIIEQFKKYDDITADLRGIQALLAYWGNEAHREILTLPIRHFCGRLKGEMDSNLRWYPVVLLFYSAGIASVSGGRYDNLLTLMQARVSDPRILRKEVSITVDVMSALSDLKTAFKMLPAHEMQYVPQSEYFFKLLQPEFDDLLFLGTEYEFDFDEFEVLFALERMDQFEKNERGRAMPGRFAWKYSQGDHSSPLHRIHDQAKKFGESWPPIKAGFFNGSIDRFDEIFKKYCDFIAKLPYN